jgi:uncharacterized protein YciI
VEEPVEGERVSPRHPTHTLTKTVVPNRRATAYGDGMVVVELAFSDSTARLPLRPRHREILADLHAAGEVLTAGPFDDGSGSMVVFTTTRDRVDEVLATDPYYAADGVTVVGVRELTSLFTD